MIYPYRCSATACENEFDIIRTCAEEFATDRNPEICPKCSDIAHRYIATAFVQADIEEGYNPAFGVRVKSKSHKRELLKKMKDMGKEMEEIGTEPVENLHRRYERQREEKSQRRWEEV